MFPFDIFHDLANDLVGRFFVDAHWWVKLVTHLVVMYGPAALVLLLVIRGAQLWMRRRARLTRHVPHSAGTAPGDLLAGSLVPGLFRYVMQRTWRNQIALIAMAGLSMPILYATLELPKQIINHALRADHFPTTHYGIEFEQVEFLVFLCLLYLAFVFVNGGIKYLANVYQGRLSERTLRRLRLTVYRNWRRRNRPGGSAQLIPVIVQELEPVGGFVGESVVVPVLQGGTFLTILTFMLIQNPALGAAAMALLPVQLVVIPRLQRRVTALARARVREVRHLGESIGREKASADSDNLRKIFLSFRTIQQIRFELFKRKYFMKGLNNFIGHMTPFFFYTIGGYLVIDGQLSLGALVAVLTAYKDFSSPLKELFRYYQTMDDVRVRYEEIRAYLANGRQASFCLAPMPENGVLPVVREASS